MNIEDLKVVKAAMLESRIDPEDHSWGPLYEMAAERRKAALALIDRALSAPDHKSVPMPQNEDEAALMALLGELWLREHAPHRLKRAEQRGEVVGWLTDQGTFHFDKTDAWNDSEGFIEPLYAAPPAPSVPDDVANDAARFRWLLEDHADPETRDVAKALLVSMRTRSLAGARLDIDAAMLAAAPEVKS